MNSNEGKQKFFVIYQITNLLDNKIYVGAHSTFNVNDKYMGSSKYLKKDIKELGRQNFKKEILHVFDNKEDMIKMESEIVNKEFCYRIDTYNKMIGGITDFNWSGMIVAKDKEGNVHSIYKDDPRWLSGELVGITKNIVGKTKGFASYKDKEENYFYISINDPIIITKQLVGFTKGCKKNIGFKNRIHSEETKRKMSDKGKLRVSKNSSQYGTCWITNGTENKKIKKELLEEYLEQGYYKGRIYTSLA